MNGRGMAWNDFILWLFEISIFLTVFSIGLRASHRDALYLFRHPRALLLSVLSMGVVMPAIAVAATLLFDLHPAVRLALVALSVSPVPPFLPLRIMKAGGKPEYTVSLLAITAALAVVVIPAAVAIFSEAYSVRLRRPPMEILEVSFASVLLPLVLGMIARRGLPAVAKRWEKPLPLLGMALLLLSLAAILFGLREAIAALTRVSTFVALGGFAFLGFLVGDLLGGLKAEDRTVLAFATAMRHPGVALYVAHGNAAADQAVFAAILLYLILGLMVSSLYMAGRRRFDARGRPDQDQPLRPGSMAWSRL
jgi:BASS family bile acid:Na+ symporter